MALDTNRIAINLAIDKAELEDIKQVTGVDANATAILAAARQGRDFLKKSKELAERAILESVKARQSSIGG